MEHCLEPREVAGLLGLAADDPRLRHLETCPRCRALVQAHAEFLEPGDTSDLADLAGADAELQRRLAEALETEPIPFPRPRRRRVWLAAAAVLALCALGLAAGDLLRLRNGGPPAAGQRLRGGASAPGLVTEVLADGLRVGWAGTPEADTVVFILFDADLNELGRFAGPAAGFALNADYPLTAASYYQAVAVARGDTVARSAVIDLQRALE